MGRGRAEGRPAVRRDRACGPHVELVRSGPGGRPERPAGGRSLRRQAHQGRRQGPVVGGPRSAGPVCPEPQARRQARRRLLRKVLQADQAAHRRLQARPALFRRRHAAAERFRSGLWPEHRRPLLQRQHRLARRQRGGDEHQGPERSTAEGPGLGHRARQERPLGAVSLADRHLHRRLALQPRHLSSITATRRRPR